METIIFAVIVGLGLAFFATQNTQGVLIHFLSFHWNAIPLYVIIIVALLVGLVLAWIFSLLQSFSSFLSLHNKENKLREAYQSITELTKRVHQLELENTRIKRKNTDEDEDL